MDFDEIDEIVDSEVCEGQHAIVADPVDPYYAVFDAIVLATSDSQSSSSPRSLATWLIVVTWCTLLICMIRRPGLE